MESVSSTRQIIFAGGIFRDLIAYSERFPKDGETIFGSTFKTGFGGKTANQVEQICVFAFLCNHFIRSTLGCYVCQIRGKRCHAWDCRK